MYFKRKILYVFHWSVVYADTITWKKNPVIACYTVFGSCEGVLIYSIQCVIYSIQYIITYNPFRSLRNVIEMYVIDQLMQMT